MPYRPHAGSMPARAIALLRGGEPLTERELAIALRVRHDGLAARLHRPIQAGYIRLNDGQFTAGDRAPEAFRGARGEGRQQRAATPGVEVLESRRRHRGSLRELLMSGAALDVGNPLRELADMMDAARDVLHAKTTSHFSTAEVDVVVARELRAVMDTVGRATANLKQLLEVM